MSDPIPAAAAPPGAPPSAPPKPPPDSAAVLTTEEKKPSFEELLKLCTRKERRFVVEFLFDEKGARAVVRAGCYSGHRPDHKAWKLKRRPRVAAAIEAGLREIKEKAKERALVKKEDVVRELAGIAFADAAEISELRIESCRYCWGRGHRYQETPAEQETRREAYEEKIASNALLPKPAPLKPFDERGGIGFNPNLRPHPKCPECHGHGVERELFHDTRGLSPAARALFAGVKRTRDGLEIKTHAKDKALELLARHVGGFSEKHEHMGEGGGPIKLEDTRERNLSLLEQLAKRLAGGNSGAAAGRGAPEGHSGDDAGGGGEVSNGVEKLVGETKPTSAGDEP
jgi:hypothetical protein